MTILGFKLLAGKQAGGQPPRAPVWLAVGVGAKAVDECQELIKK